MDEFPEPDEEFDDFIETTRNEISQKPPSAENNRKENLNATVSQKSSQAVRNLDDIAAFAHPSTSHPDCNGDTLFGEPTRKRTYEELLNAFDDNFADDDFFEIPDARDKRPRWSDSPAVIEYILKERKNHKNQQNAIETRGRTYIQEPTEDSISMRVPSWNFVALTRCSDSQRIYVRVRSNKRKNIELRSRSSCNLFALPFSQMKAEAEEIILRNQERARLPTAVTNSKKSDDQLWVDKYRPHTYMELLTDESVNRACLSWIKLWDKIVFNREIVKRKRLNDVPKFGNKKFFYKTEADGVDARGFPIQRIALLSGPPGLGKTTLAHLVAKHAGYRVVEVNSSDDRSPEAFKTALLAATEMRSLMGADPRPNCLILDEIDGASAASIELLIKYVQGRLAPKGKKNKDAGKKSNECKRPVICICNEAYTPSLRPLRAMAFIITVPKISAARLADRLEIIAHKEKLKTDQRALLQLAERSGCDVRSCLCALQYMGEACVSSNSSLGLKDSKRGFFESLRDILQVPMNRGGMLPVRERIQIVLKAAYSGETERLAQGIFHNYPETSPPKLDMISKSLEWFQLYDKITTVVMTRQDWRVMPYTHYAFVAWHFGLASNQYIKLSYPYAAAEVNQKLNKNIAMLTTTRRTYGRDTETLAMDITPFLSELLTPRLRSVSGHLYSPKERADLDRLIKVMLDLGLSLVQTKAEDRGVDYNFDPNLSEIGIFHDCKVRRAMPYAVKQIVAQELEIERVKRTAAHSASRHPKPSESDENSEKVTKAVEKEREIIEPPVPAVPNHLRYLKPKPMDVQSKPTKYRNFFENFVPKTSSSKQKSPGTSPRGPKTIHRFRQVMTQHGVWYKYKEGFSNSVRRYVKIADLL